MRLFLPERKQELMEGDRLLFAARGVARHEMVYSLTEPALLAGLATGRLLPRGAIMRKLVRRRADS